MTVHKKTGPSDGPLAEASTRALRARRRRLLGRLPDLEGYVAGSLVEQSRRCGKPGCRCVSGDLHGPYVYLSVPAASGRRGLIYVPEPLGDLMAEKVAASAAGVMETLGCGMPNGEAAGGAEALRALIAGEPEADERQAVVGRLRRLCRVATRVLPASGAGVSVLTGDARRRGLFRPGQ